MCAITTKLEKYFGHKKYISIHWVVQIASLFTYLLFVQSEFRIKITKSGNESKFIYSMVLINDTTVSMSFDS